MANIGYILKISVKHRLISVKHRLIFHDGFYSQNCHFSRIALLYFKSALLFSRSVFLFNVCVSFKWFFSKVVLLSTCPAYSCSEMIFALLLKPLRGVSFLMHLIQVLFSMIAWKMQFLRI